MSAVEVQGAVHSVRRMDIPSPVSNLFTHTDEVNRNCVGIWEIGHYDSRT